MLLPRLNLETHEVAVRGRPVRYHAGGDGPPIILIHGLSASSTWWAHNVEELTREHRVYLFDLPGFGSMRRHNRFVLAESAVWLASVMAELGMPRADLLGHSMGGVVVLGLAAAHPELIRRLVLVAPAVGLKNSALVQLMALAAEARYSRPALFPVMLRDALRAGPFTIVRAGRELLMTERPVVDSIHAPTLLVWGDRDAVVPVSVGRTLRSEMPNSRLLLLHGAGHVSFLDRADEFNKSVLEFLRGGEVGT